MEGLEYLTERIERKQAAKNRRIDTSWIVDDPVYAAALELGRQVAALEHGHTPSYKH